MPDLARASAGIFRINIRIKTGGGTFWARDALSHPPVRALTEMLRS